MVEIQVPEGESRVTAAVGDTLVVSLVEPGATGYQWTTSADGAAVVEDSSELRLTEDSPPGRAGSRVVSLRAVEAGSADVTFSLRRVWEDAGPVEQLTLRVDVHDALVD